MNKTKHLLLGIVLLTALLFRIFINYFLSINQLSSDQSLILPAWLMISFGLVNLIMLFSIIQKKANYKIGLFAALLYALSPWTAYLELTASFYIILLTILLFIYKMGQIFSINTKYSLMLLIAVITIFVFMFNQIKIFSNVGLINAVNSFRGETNQTVFAPLGKVIENRYIYLSEHMLLNVLKQFTPATYFTNQAKLLGFSFAPPIYLGFIIPFLFGFLKLIKPLTKGDIFKIIMAFFLLVPSILSKNSPDLVRLIIISPVIFFIISSGLYNFLLDYKKGIFRFLLFLTLFMVVLQFFTTISDIVIREPIRLQTFLGKI